MEAVQAATELHEIVSRYWGYDSLRPLQREAMAAVLASRDSLVVLPTGGGKSLCFQAPAMMMPGLAVVVSPLISLMKDQVDALAACGVPAAAVNSSMPTEEQRRVAERIRRGEVKLLYVAPERLVSSRMIGFLQSVDVSLFAIDEAHCISAWGHDFRPEYRGMSMLKKIFPDVAVHAYTATASAQVRDDIVKQLGFKNAEVLVGSFDRPNLVYRVREGRKQRFEQVVEAVKRHRGESGIVYCISRREVDSTADALRALGYKASAYHAGLSDEDRHRAQEDFLADRVDIIVATVAFGMGIDKPDVRFVVHAGMPKSLEAYQQESGRAGRDGLEAECLLLHSPGDTMTWKRLLSSGDTTPAALQISLQSLAGMGRYATSAQCRHKSLVEFFGQRYDKKNCGACDVCLTEVELVAEPLIVAQKILSCVVRIDQRYGGDYTAKVLTGSQEARILEMGHDKLSTYGIMRDTRVGAVRDWIEQLVGQGYLQKSGEYDVLQLTPTGAELLRGRGEPKLLKPAKREAKAARTTSDEWEGVDRPLFEHLRELRKQLAAEDGVPAYVVFGDTTLRELARLRPSTLDRLAQVKGVGQKKLDSYGQQFLAAIVDFASTNGLAVDVSDELGEIHPPTQGGAGGGFSQPGDDQPTGPSRAALRMFPHFAEGKSIDEVCTVTGRARSTIVGYLNEFLKHEGIDDATAWVASDVAHRIEDAIAHCGNGKLKPLYEHLGGEIEYDDIRIVAICVSNRS